MLINDTAGSLSSSDVQVLQSMRTPFDVHVTVTSADSRLGLEIHTHAEVTSSNTVAIGVDPVHHYTFTHFGTGTGISPTDYQSIAHAGNGEFHVGRWADGIRAIVNAASAASTEGQRGSVVIQQPTTVVDHEVSPWPFVVGGGVLILVFAFLWHVIRKRQRAVDQSINEFKDEAQELRSRNIEEQGWHDKMAAQMPVDKATRMAVAASPILPAPPMPAQPPRPANAGSGVGRMELDRMLARERAAASVPIIVNQSSNDGFLTGMLMGEEMSRPAVVEREVIRETPRYDPPSYDPPDMSSSFDTGSVFDGGGGGGGFDSGGGFDGGGGGGDF